MTNKLELTWVGKEKEIKVEPRILIENPQLSNMGKVSAKVGQASFFDEPTSDNFDNMLIHGDNLLALKALEAKYAGQIKCIYIDPPYNTGNAFEHYDDNLEHSIWLNLMRPRLECLRRLLKDDGFLFVQIDDEECAYLTVLLDEIFGRKNRINTIAVKMSEPTGVKMSHTDKRLPKLKEYILVYRKDEVVLNEVKIPKEKWDSEYKLYIKNAKKEEIDRVKEVMNTENPSDELLEEADNILANYEVCNIEEVFRELKIADEDKERFKYDNAWRIMRDVATTGGAKLIADKKREACNGNFFVIRTPQKKVYLIKNNYNMESSQPRIKMLFADDYLMVNPCDLWTDIATTGLDNEGIVEFRKSKKPEKLISRILEISTKRGDLVLDSFLGSGTTAAVAHKMGRKWIGIEMGAHAYTHCKVRMDKVIEGEQGGISKAVNWKGGGGYKFYELAPSLVVEDKFGMPIINKEYNADMLSAAMALHEGYAYCPDENYFWKQGKNENSYIFTTTQHVTESFLEMISKEMQEGESLIVACKSYEQGVDKLFKNIFVKKIPKVLLDKCQFGVENYNLNIIDIPEIDEDEE